MNRLLKDVEDSGIGGQWTKHRKRTILFNKKRLMKRQSTSPQFLTIMVGPTTTHYFLHAFFKFTVAAPPLEHLITYAVPYISGICSTLSQGIKSFYVTKPTICIYGVLVLPH